MIDFDLRIIGLCDSSAKQCTLSGRNPYADLRDCRRRDRRRALKGPRRVPPARVRPRAHLRHGDGSCAIDCDLVVQKE